MKKQGPSTGYYNESIFLSTNPNPRLIVHGLGQANIKVLMGRQEAKGQIQITAVREGGGRIFFTEFKIIFLSCPNEKHCVLVLFRQCC